jgi:hypothetical protein
LRQDGLVTRQTAFQHLPRVLQAMKPVGDLFGLWRPQGRPGGVVPASIAPDEAHRGMRLQPLGDAEWRAVRQQVNHPLLFQIY